MLVQPFLPLSSVTIHTHINGRGGGVKNEEKTVGVSYVLVKITRDRELAIQRW